MRSRWLLLVSSLLFVPFAPSDSSGTEKENSKDGVIAEIRGVLSAQQEAWNHGDIDGFMNGYARAETTVFVSGDEVTRSWQTVRDRYFKHYGDRAKIGTHTAADRELEQLGADSAIDLGRWELERSNDNPHGRFALIVRHPRYG